MVSMIELAVLAGLTLVLARAFAWPHRASLLAALKCRIPLQLRETLDEMNYARRRSYELMTLVPRDNEEQLTEPGRHRH